MKGRSLRPASRPISQAVIALILIIIGFSMASPAALADFSPPVTHVSIPALKDPNDLGLTMTIDKDTIYPNSDSFAVVTVKPIYKSTGEPAYGATVTLECTTTGDTMTAMFDGGTPALQGDNISFVTSASSPALSVKFRSQLPGEYSIIATATMEGYNVNGSTRQVYVIDMPAATPTALPTPTSTVLPAGKPTATAKPTAATVTVTGNATAATATPTVTTTPAGENTTAPTTGTSNAGCCMPLLAAPLLAVCVMCLSRLDRKK